MTYRKTWLSYMLWAILTCLTGVTLTAYGALFWQWVIGYKLSLYFIGFLAAIFYFIILCYVFIRKILSPFIVCIMGLKPSPLGETFR